MLFLRFAGTIIEQCVLYNIHWNRFFPILNIYYSNPNMVQWCLLSEECGVSHSKTKKLLKNEVFLALCSFSNLIAISAGSISALAIVQFHFFSLFLSCFSQFNFSAGNVIFISPGTRCCCSCKNSAFVNGNDGMKEKYFVAFPYHHGIIGISCLSSGSI